MRRVPTQRNWLIRTMPALLAVVVAGAATLATSAAPPAERRGPERAIGGLTKAERITRMQALHAELMARMPAGATNAPVFVDITQEDRDAIDHPVVTGRVPQRIGVVKSIGELVGKKGGGPFTHGVVKQEQNGTFVWATTVTSPGAQAIRLHLTGFSLPPGAEMFLVGSDGQADGPYVDRGRNGDGDFWTRSIVGETGTVMLRYNGTRPKVDEPRIAFVIEDLGHIRGRQPQPTYESHDSWPCSNNAPCVVDAQCVNEPAVSVARDAVAKLEWITGRFINTCTGGLVADTDGSSQIPYMLSANHCFSSSISNLETFFDYTTSSCNGSCPDSLVTGGTPPAADTVGMTVVATGSNSDYTLMTLNEAPPAGAAFLGWNTTPVAFSNGTHLYRISNANFGPQVYSQHDVDTGSPQCSGIPRGGWIYSKDQTGVTMGGSSGSPVVNGAGEIVGQLTGCCGFNCANDCDTANNWTIDGALANYFSNVEEFLDPQTGGCTTDPECNDGLFCTGTETCNGGTCQSSGDPCGAGETCNEATDTCDAPPAGCGDLICDPGEDCNNCPTDCRAKTSGSPSSRYCCDGDLPGCGNPACTGGGFTCGDDLCSSDPECNDGQFCNGVETCSAGMCQAGINPCPQGCDEGSDQCVACGVNKDPCSSNSDCCSNNCKNGTCKGN